MDENQPSELNPLNSPSLNNTASHWQRFWAAIIDGASGFMVSLPLFNHYNLWELMAAGGEVPTNVFIIMSIYALSMFFVLHGALLYKYGQTLGKRVMGLAIVTLDGCQPSFKHLILNRYLPQWVAGFVPVIGPLLGIVDVLFIFRDDKRCVHDLIAGTKVIDLKVKSVPQSGSLIL